MEVKYEYYMSEFGGEEIPEEKQSQIRSEKWGVCLILAAVMLGGVGFLQKNRKENRHK